MVPRMAPKSVHRPSPTEQRSWHDSAPGLIPLDLISPLRLPCDSLTHVEKEHDALRGARGTHTHTLLQVWLLRQGEERAEDSDAWSDCAPRVLRKKGRNDNTGRPVMNWGVWYRPSRSTAGGQQRDAH